MGTLLSILLFFGVMLLMSKLGIGCCGGHSNHSGHQHDTTGNSLTDGQDTLVPVKVPNDRK